MAIVCILRSKNGSVFYKLVVETDAITKKELLVLLSEKGPAYGLFCECVDKRLSVAET